MNGHQIAEENYQKFLSWISSKTNSDYKQMVLRGRLCRKEIAAECGFCQSVINQNPRIKKALLELEDKLREKGILPEKVEKSKEDKLPTRNINHAKNQRDSIRLNKLEQENAALHAENQRFKETLKRYQLLEEVIAETGRMSR